MQSYLLSRVTIYHLSMVSKLLRWERVLIIAPVLCRIKSLISPLVVDLHLSVLERYVEPLDFCVVRHENARDTHSRESLLEINDIFLSTTEKEAA